ncbi:MAG: response regulator [Candidatus Nitrohelix vancouverensis]|uniref:Response regulator n=1 Tax=Candidatus Nitrohelix vancouverensis TaxID=2705534 RepID=A0A7T0C2Z0_9BACT|nr:MAG: response regulator [Candidatus Nitrohelix vancouverensis]
MSLMDETSSTKGKILIVDDEADVREVLKLHLAAGKFSVLEASNGEEAITLMKMGSNLVQVGLIICDIRMPKVNGIDAINYIRSNAPSIPILVITGYPDTNLAVSLMEKGVKGYLVKPVEKDVLLKKVKEVFEAPQDFQYA